MIRLSGIKQDERGTYYFLTPDQQRADTIMPLRIGVRGKYCPKPGEELIHLVNLDTEQRI